MFLPQTQGSPEAAYIQEFRGLDRRAEADANEFSDCLNMSNDQYPCIMSMPDSAAVLAKANIQGIIAPQYTSDEELESFTGSANGYFWYNGEQKSFESTGMTLGNGDVQLVDFNGRILMFPQKYYYDYTAQGDGTVHFMEQGFRNASITSVEGRTNTDDDGNITEYVNIITVPAGSTDMISGFLSGDSVFIEGMEDEENNSLYLDSKFSKADENRIMSAIVYKVDGRKLYLRLYNKAGKQMTFKNASNQSGVSVYIKIPDMNWVCVHNNRLWGTNPNGEQIHASKIGDPFNFFTFEGLASDSWYSEIGTPGGFVGVVSYRDNVVAFKRDYIHHVYGDKPVNFNIPKQLSDVGCTDIRSAVECGTILYYLGYNGFYAYAGGQPLIISDKLNERYISAAAFSDGVKYYAAAVTASGRNEMLCYDPRYQTWQKLTPYDDVKGFIRWHNRTYFAAEDGEDTGHVYELFGGEYGDWFMQSAKISENTVDKKTMTDIFIYAELSDGAEIAVLLQNGDGDWKECHRLQYYGLKTARIPIRAEMTDYYRIGIAGTGRCTIHGIERRTAKGGRSWSVHI